ncbi:carboxypeptidase [Vagococcus martis]|uniref:Carboxypeptidase n=1 Tax=Vagococcus martis TaxID=1768210 RepID=A0A1V4DFT8_9ENTE|nr:S66 peptidase family protein [Vagococcus martis]OPF87352.1 carboxypeptidase [Vagococcus martis]
MIKPRRLKRGDKVAIVSLSKGLLGEEFVEHNLILGKKRLEDCGLDVVFMPHALKGIDFVDRHPEKRAEDLIQAFEDNSIKGIICAIGGDDTYRTLPYLMENDKFKDLVKTKPKLFTGFSDSTINHLMFYHLGLTTYYGMAFIPDLGEISDSMLPYTENYFSYYFEESPLYEVIKPSEVWYDERLDFSKKALGQQRISHVETKGYEWLQGKSVFEGELLGGCIDSLYDMLTPFTHSDEPKVIERYGIFPDLTTWQGKILFNETSEVKESPETVEKMLGVLKDKGIFDVVNGVIFGKPQDEVFYEEYKQSLVKVVDNEELPVVCNVNFGHATPRCVLPYGVRVQVDSEKQEIRLLESAFYEEDNHGN